MTSGAEHVPETSRDGHVSVIELARQQGVRPIASVDDLRADVFDSDQELDEFLADLYASRRADLA